MRTKALSALIALSAMTALPAAAQKYSELGPGARRFVAVSDTLVALDHLKLVDGTGAEPVGDQTILISGGKITAVGLGGAVATIGTWIIDQAGVSVPATVAAAITTVAVFAAGYLTHDG